MPLDMQVNLLRYLQGKTIIGKSRQMRLSRNTLYEKMRSYMINR